MASDDASPKTSRDDQRRFNQKIYNATKLPFAEASEFFRGKAKIEPTNEWREMLRERHDRAFTVAGLAHEESLRGVRRLVQQAIDGGQTAQDFRKSLETLLANNGQKLRGNLRSRAQTIFDTNVRTAYAAGRLQQLEQAKSISPYWVYRHGGSATPRSEHLAMDGKVLPADDPAWKTIYPPNGWGCSCTVEAVSERQLEKMGGLEANRLKVQLGDNGLPVGVQSGWDYMPGATADPFSGETRNPDKTFAGRRRLEESGQRWQASLTDEERKAVATYTDFNLSLPGAPSVARKSGDELPARASAFEEINALLRGDSPAGLTPDRKDLLGKQARLLRSALGKFVPAQDFVVFRGTAIKNAVHCTNPRVGDDIEPGDSDLAKIRKLDSALTDGTIWTNPGFSSSSVSAVGAFDQSLVLRIHVRKGMRCGAFVKFGSETPEQDEFLLAPGTPLVVTQRHIEWRAIKTAPGEDGFKPRAVLVLVCEVKGR